METTTNTIHQKYRTSKWKTKTSPSIRDKISSPRATFGNAKITGVLSFSFPESSFNYTKKAKPYSLFQYPQNLSLSLFSRTLIFFFKNIQFLQYRLQVCSLIQSFSNSRFTYLFLALYIIELLKFLIFF